MGARCTRGSVVVLARTCGDTLGANGFVELKLIGREEEEEVGFVCVDDDDEEEEDCGCCG